MAYIYSHQQLERHPKTLDLMTIMGWNINETIGYLHRFWWWVLDYAEDGDLRKHEGRIGFSVGLTGDDVQKFSNALRDCRWVDTEPFLRVHDWWSWVGAYLKAKYRNDPDKWQRVRDSYADTVSDTVSNTNAPATRIDSKVEKIKENSFIDIVNKVVTHLNNKSGKHYDSAKKGTVGLIKARLADGFTFEDFVAVIDFKVGEWSHDDKMSQYLRPQTLFIPSHFEDYLQAAKHRKRGGDGKGNRENASGDRASKYGKVTKKVELQ